MPRETPKYHVGQTNNIVNAFAKRTAEDSCAYLLSSLTPDMTILDVGCGPGSITIDLARHVPRGHVVGIDIEAAASTLDKGRTQAQMEGVMNVEFRTGNGYTLPFPDDTFDATHSHQVLHQIDDPVHFMREMHRVTKPGGFIASRVWDTGSWILHPQDEGITSFRTMTQRINSERGLVPFAGRNLHIWARKAGFEAGRVKISTSTMTFRTPEERIYVGELFRAISQESDFATMALKKGYVTGEGLERMAEGWQRWIDDDDGPFAWINFELLYQK
ncbi:uncharacterized protein PHACADRAFT_249190 [Phanerochaete carnosa HHB-10118-sp]|uniref:Methyltransferase domain-containing protein n=1 Tax=Phanerochaete carnosa (strain HHB-10118-sp) TaxID=650164 RepID=K5X825_PHACS|nr:uncharacterized protein PHACADRAFT_249190 [Phanerochaete carnosa HHB-10118-sp]EKM59027.1 hypothetical protein PHACADRAFT_249190 [Phanerochaete carnosa HHB-10118-sp]